jgi:hypothetical protein
VVSALYLIAEGSTKTSSPTKTGEWGLGESKEMVEILKEKVIE